MTTLEILQATRERLSDPANWNHAGPNLLRTEGPQCVGLTLSNFGDSGNGYQAHNALGFALGFPALEIKNQRATRIVYNWNDAPETTHADVLAALDAAIEAESA